MPQQLDLGAAGVRRGPHAHVAYIIDGDDKTNMTQVSNFHLRAKLSTLR